MDEREEYKSFTTNKSDSERQMSSNSRDGKMMNEKMHKDLEINDRKKCEQVQVDGKMGKI